MSELVEMPEDFQESEVMFRETAGGDERRDWFYGYVPELMGDIDTVMKRRKEMKGESDSTCSLPVNIPEVWRGDDMRWFRSDVFGEDEMIVPPHEIIDRRVAGKVAFSVCTGNGRTLKGRDLSRVRNAILRMTGFLES